MRVLFQTLCVLMLTPGCEAPAANSEAGGEGEVAFTARDLQGVWKRTDYPYGTLEFRDDEVKINVGEGMPEPPSFQPFTLSDRCPEGESPELTTTDRRYLVHDDDRCAVISLTNDTLRQSDAAGSYVITFVKEK